MNNTYGRKGELIAMLIEAGSSGLTSEEILIRLFGADNERSDNTFRSILRRIKEDRTPEIESIRCYRIRNLKRPSPQKVPLPEATEMGAWILAIAERMGPVCEQDVALMASSVLDARVKLAMLELVRRGMGSIEINEDGSLIFYA
jgi:hypothetical protein